MVATYRHRINVILCQYFCKESNSSVTHDSHLSETPFTPQQHMFIRWGTVAALIVFSIIVVVVTIPGRISWDFRNNLHGPAQMVTQGLSAYDTSITGYPDSVWFPTIIGQYFWLGWFSFETAAFIWMMFVAVCLVLAIYLCLPRYEPVWAVFGVLLGVAFFPPLYVHHNIGQISVYTMLLLLLCVFALEDERPMLVGILIALASAKPQLILLPLLGIAIALWQQGGWHVWLKAGIAGAITGLLSLVPLFIADPEWLAVYVGNLQQMADWSRPTVARILDVALGVRGPIVFVPIALTVIALNLWLWQRLSMRVAMLWSMGLNLIAIPLVWTWDFVMLLPLFAYYLFALQSWVGRIIIIVTMLVVDVGYIYTRAMVSGDAALDWWIPPVMLIGIGFAIWVDYQQASPKDTTM